MSPEKQRIVIGKACGLHLHDGDHAPSNYLFSSDLPDYLNDLNAMWRAVRSGLTGSERLRAYEAHLQELSPDYPTEATASQLAEDFLKTLDLWQDES